MSYAAALEEAIHLLLDYGEVGKVMVRPVGLIIRYRPETEAHHAQLIAGHKDAFPSRSEVRAIAAVLQRALPGTPRLVPKLKRIEPFGCAIFEWQTRAKRFQIAPRRPFTRQNWANKEVDIESSVGSQRRGIFVGVGDAADLNQLASTKSRDG